MKETGRVFTTLSKTAEGQVFPVFANLLTAARYSILHLSSDEKGKGPEPAGPLLRCGRPISGPSPAYRLSRSLRLLTLTMFDQVSLPSRLIPRSLFRSAVFAVSD
jgi:hypothetical protein